MNSKELALSIAKFLDSKKATDLEVIQIGELTTIGDYFVVATASNTTLVKSLCEDLDEYLGRQGIEPKRIEGRSSAQWILMDYRDVIVHIFYAETRNFYSDLNLDIPPACRWSWKARKNKFDQAP